MAIPGEISSSPAAARTRNDGFGTHYFIPLNYRAQNSRRIPATQVATPGKYRLPQTGLVLLHHIMDVGPPLITSATRYIRRYTLVTSRVCPVIPGRAPGTPGWHRGSLGNS